MANKKYTFQEALLEVKNRLDIVSVVGAYVPIKKRGHNHVGLCPFHSDRSPSFHVSSHKEIYKCFSCGASGDMFKFLMEYRGISFGESVRELARQCGIEVESKREANDEADQQRQLLLLVQSLAVDFFVAQLKEPQGQEALEYLFSKRKLSREGLEKFTLGYAPRQLGGLYKHLIAREDLREATSQLDLEEILSQSGLFYRDEDSGRLMERFRHRLMIPIRDSEGRTIGFGARALGAEQHPKYLNSPETPLFSKGENLYAYGAAKRASKEAGKILLLEGYFDVLQAHQHGLPFAVAGLGTALTPRQASLLYQSNPSRNIVLAYDADAAGLKALETALGVFHNLSVPSPPNLYALRLQEHKDIDDYLLAGGDAEELMREHTVDAYEFLLQSKVATINLQDEGVRRSTLVQLAEVFGAIPDPLQKEIVAEKCARLFAFTKGAVTQVFEAKASRSRSAPQRLNSTANREQQGGGRFSKDKRKSSYRGGRPTPRAHPLIYREKALLALLLLSDEESIKAAIRDHEFTTSITRQLRDRLLQLSLTERHNIPSREEGEDEHAELVAGWREIATEAAELQEADWQDILRRNLAEQPAYRAFRKLGSRANPPSQGT